MPLLGRYQVSAHGRARWDSGRGVHHGTVACHVLHHQPRATNVHQSESAVAIALADVEAQAAFGDLVHVRGGGVVCVRGADSVVSNAVHFDVLLAVVVAIDECCRIVFVQQRLDVFHLWRVRGCCSRLITRHSNGVVGDLFCNLE